MFECVINIAEGRNVETLRALDEAAGTSLRDRHSDHHHHRSVFTLLGSADALRRDVRHLTSAAFEALDLTHHVGVHPRLGVVDVVPFVALDDSPFDEAVALREETATWISSEFDVPCFYYGPTAGGTRSLPEVRRHAFVDLAPDTGPHTRHPRWGAVAIGARPILVAWNLWLRDVPLAEAQRVATIVRRSSPAVRALAFDLGTHVQVSCNLIAVPSFEDQREPGRVTTTPSVIYDLVARELSSGVIDHAELVGLIPQSLLEAESPTRWTQLDLSPDVTIELRRGGD